MVMAKKLLTKAVLRQFKQNLIKLKKRLESNVAQLEDKTLKKNPQEASGDLSSFPLHIADIGSDEFERGVSLGMMEDEGNTLKEINSAIERIETGKYGICENCKKPIGKLRLKTLPYARLCVKCKEKEESSL
jgi:RNA polymerase-binding protein DksA